MAKRDGRRLGRDALAHIRLQAVREIREGESPETIARRLGFCRQIVYKWVRRARAQGLAWREVAPGLMESQSLESQSVLTSSLSRFLFFPGAPLGLVASRGVSEYLPGPQEIDPERS